MPPLSDNIAASESLSHYSDQVDVNERLTVFTNILSLSASDAATLIEAISANPDVPSVNKADNVTVSESASFDIPTSLSTTDSLAVTDSASVQLYNPLPDISLIVTAGIQQTGGVRVV